MTQHGITVRVYYEDTDFSGLVYHSELVRDGVAFAVRRMEIDFVAPARIDDLLEVTTTIARSTGARLMLDQRIARAGAELTRAIVEVVAIHLDGKPARLPAALRG
jgi:acyl-CoA thioester hydrolase